MIGKIISGGHTGVDRGALDFAIGIGLDYEGYCPRGRLSEDGKIHDKYNLNETEGDKYTIRTRLNVDCSDGALIFYTADFFPSIKINQFLKSMYSGI